MPISPRSIKPWSQTPTFPIQPKSQSWCMLMLLVDGMTSVAVGKQDCLHTMLGLSKPWSGVGEVDARQCSWPWEKHNPPQNLTVTCVGSVDQSHSTLPLHTDNAFTGLLVYPDRDFFNIDKPILPEWYIKKPDSNFFLDSSFVHSFIIKINDPILASLIHWLKWKTYITAWCWMS